MRYLLGTKKDIPFARLQYSFPFLHTFSSTYKTTFDFVKIMFFFTHNKRPNLFITNIENSNYLS